MTNIVPFGFFKVCPRDLLASLVNFLNLHDLKNLAHTSKHVHGRLIEPGVVRNLSVDMYVDPPDAYLLPLYKNLETFYIDDVESTRWLSVLPGILRLSTSSLKALVLPSTLGVPLIMNDETRPDILAPGLMTLKIESSVNEINQQCLAYDQIPTFLDLLPLQLRVLGLPHLWPIRPPQLGRFNQLTSFHGCSTSLAQISNKPTSVLICGSPLSGKTTVAINILASLPPLDKPAYVSTQTPDMWNGLVPADHVSRNLNPSFLLALLEEHEMLLNNGAPQCWAIIIDDALYDLSIGQRALLLNQLLTRMHRCGGYLIITVQGVFNILNNAKILFSLRIQLGNDKASIQHFWKLYAESSYPDFSKFYSNFYLLATNNGAPGNAFVINTKGTIFAWPIPWISPE